jgi:hypothetical protein
MKLVDSSVTSKPIKITLRKPGAQPPGPSGDETVSADRNPNKLIESEPASLPVVAAPQNQPVVIANPVPGSAPSAVVAKMADDIIADSEPAVAKVAKQRKPRMKKISKDKDIMPEKKVRVKKVKEVVKKVVKEVKAKSGKKSSCWIEHAKLYAEHHGVSFKQALVDSRASYTKVASV